MRTMVIFAMVGLLSLWVRGQGASRGAFYGGTVGARLGGGGVARPGGGVLWLDRGEVAALDGDGAARPGGGGVPRAVEDARPYYSRHVSSGGIRLELTGVYVDSGVLWFAFRSINRSAIDFRSGGMRFVIRDRRTLKRRALQELRLVPVVRQEARVLRADSAVRLYYGLMPRVPSRRQELVIEWMERNGDRRMQLRVPASILLTAHRL